MNNIDKWKEKHKLAQQYLNKSVLSIADDFLLSKKKYEELDYHLMGIKDTFHIKKEWIDLLKKQFIHHTVDTVAHKGRAIDPLLINPLTFRRMTGSSSGTAINVLLGINDLGLGTDGGGSVIYPALSVNLYSVMLAGLGFTSNISKKSTDNITFMPSLGLISFHKDILNKSLNLLVGHQAISDITQKTAGDKESLDFFQEQGDRITIPDSDDRIVLINFFNDLMLRYNLILIKESHIDIQGYDDSVLGTTSEFFALQQKYSHKKAGKILNMIHASVFTIPDKEAASGYLIIARQGIESFYKAWNLFNKIEEQRTKLFMEYFGD